MEIKQANLEWNNPRAIEATIQLITEDKVFAVVGPLSGNSTGGAVADICNTYEIPNMSWQSMELSITLNRSWVFRISAAAEFSQEALARFVTEDLKAKTAAIIFQMDERSSRMRSSAFAAAFEKLN